MKTFINNLPKLFLIFFAMTYLYSCTKQDISNVQIDTNKQTTSQQLQKAKDALRATYGNVSGGVVEPINKVLTENDLYINQNNKLVAFGSLPKSNSLGGTIPCAVNCAGASDPADLHMEYTLLYFVRTYECESNTLSNVNVTWRISVPFTPTNNNNSFGTVNITSPTGATYTQNSSGVVVKNLGNDPNCASNTLYQVDYKVTQIANSFFGSNMQFTTSLSLYNDCSLVGNLVVTGNQTTLPKFLGNTTQPCTRIDKVWLDRGSNTPSQLGLAQGNYTLCNPPSPFILTNLQQIEYRKLVNVNNTDWNAQSNLTSPIYWGIKLFGNPNDRFASVSANGSYALQFPEVTPTSGTWIVRYRNVLINQCNEIIGTNPTSGTPGAGADWGSPIYWTQVLL